MPPAGVKHEEAWLVRILINIRRDQWRRAAVRRHASSVLARVDATADSVESALIARDRVWRALDVLAPRRRAVIVMHDIDDMSVPSIAAVLGISAVTVRWHLARGRRELTRRLASEQGDPK